MTPQKINLKVHTALAGMRKKMNEQQDRSSKRKATQWRLAELARVELLHALQARPTGTQRERRW
jgi:hypothetical protein